MTTNASNACCASPDWWQFTISLLRMDPAHSLVSAFITPSLEACDSFAALHALQYNLVAVLTCPHVVAFPQRASYSCALLKLVIAQCEAAARRIVKAKSENTVCKNNDDEEEEEEDETPVVDELLELYLTCATSSSSSASGSCDAIDKNEAATFYTALLSTPFGHNSTAASPSLLVSSSHPSSNDVNHDDGATAFVKNASIMGRFVPMRVTSAFVNVGLAVWPAAHITVDLLATLVEMSCDERDGDWDQRDGDEEVKNEAAIRQTISDWFPNAPKGMLASLEAIAMMVTHHSTTRVLELGAGVGLTPAVLHKRYAFATGARRSASTPAASALPALSIAVTDYQPNILDNCTFNLEKNGVSYAHFKDSASLAAGMKLEQTQQRDSHEADCCAEKRAVSSCDDFSSNISAIVAPLDWNEREETRRVVKATRPHLAIAADCIYDRCVLEGLSETLKDAMLTPLADDSGDGEAEVSGEEKGSAGGCVPNGCVSIIIQTHRNDATQTELHGKLRAFSVVYSFHYDGEHHRLVPLEETAAEGGADCYGWRSGSKAMAVDGDDAEAAGRRCIPLARCGDWRVEMSDIMYVHFLYPKVV